MLAVTPDQVQVLLALFHPNSPLASVDFTWARSAELTHLQSGSCWRGSPWEGWYQSWTKYPCASVLIHLSAMTVHCCQQPWGWSPLWSISGLQQWKDVHPGSATSPSSLMWQEGCPGIQACWEWRVVISLLTSAEPPRKALAAPLPSPFYLPHPIWSSIKSWHSCPQRGRFGVSTLVTFTSFPLSSLLLTGQVDSYMLFFFSHHPLSCLSLPFTRQGGEVFVKWRNQSREWTNLEA